MRVMLVDAWSLAPCRVSALIASSCYSSVGGSWFVLLITLVTVFWTCPWITTLVLLLLYVGCSVPSFSRWGFVCLCQLFGCLVTDPA
jgi:hypothetical protein